MRKVCFYVAGWADETGLFSHDFTLSVSETDISRCLALSRNADRFGFWLEAGDDM
jgi:hypothetical protein